MKLRNKKTGAIYDVLIREREVGGYCSIIVCNKKAYIQNKGKFGVTHYVLDEYSLLAEFNDEWEDVDDTNVANIPLIKDEKIIKLVRAWAEAFGVTKVYAYAIGGGKEYIALNAQDNGVIDGIISISIPTQDFVCFGEEYTVDELCGSEDD